MTDYTNDFITFSTSNTIKFNLLQGFLLPEFHLQQNNLPLIEPQADTVMDVAISKAQQAHAILNQPLVVEDTAFQIDGLDGFPGVYQKYVTEKIGADGFLRLAENLSNRLCRFQSALVFVDEQGEYHQFESDDFVGTLSHQKDTTSYDFYTEEVWRIFIIDGTNQCFSTFPLDERTKLWKAVEHRSVFAKFADWLRERQSIG